MNGTCRAAAALRFPPASSPEPHPGACGRVISALLLVTTLAGCGADFRSVPDTPPSDDTARQATLRQVYDAWIEIPDLALPGRTLPATLAVDLEVTFSEDPLLDAGGAGATQPAGSGAAGSPQVSAASAGAGAGTARVSLIAEYLDGTALPPPATRLWEIGFAREDNHLRFDPLAPFEVQGIFDSLVLEADVDATGRRLSGAGVLVVLGRAGALRGVRQRNYLVATTDYAFGGSLARLRARYDSHFALFDGVEDAWTDPLVRVESGSAFLLNRFELVFSEDDDNRHVEWLSPADGYRTIFSFSAGDGANPQDLVIDARGRMWISRYEPPYDDLLIVDPRTGTHLGRLDLGAWTTGDGLAPRPEQMIRVGDAIYVTLQNSNLSFSAFGPARLLEIDTTTDSVAAAIELEGINPFQGLEREPESGLLYLALAGVFPGQQAEQFSGGVEVVDPVTRASRGILVDDDDLGGHVNDVAIASAAKAYVLISRRSGEDFLTEVVAFDPRDGTILGTVYSGGAGGRNQVADIEADGEGWLLLALRDPYDSGVRIIDTSTDRPIPGGFFRTSLFAVSLATVRPGS